MIFVQPFTESFGVVFLARLQKAEVVVEVDVLGRAKLTNQCDSLSSRSSPDETIGHPTIWSITVIDLIIQPELPSHVLFLTRLKLLDSLV